MAFFFFLVLLDTKFKRTIKRTTLELLKCSLEPTLISKNRNSRTITRGSGVAQSWKCAVIKWVVKCSSYALKLTTKATGLMSLIILKCH